MGPEKTRAWTEGAANLERPSLADQDGAVHNCRDLAHVARPPILAQHPHVVVRHGDWLEAEAVRRPLRKVLGERTDVVRAVAERRDHDGKHGKAVVKVLAERLRLDHRRQVAVRGGDDADVDAHRPLAADPDDLAVLDDAQQPDLRGKRELADLVEEQRAAVGLLEPPLRRVAAPVKAPCSWPNSSESISSGAMAPQLTRRNGPLRKVERSWIARAMISLPVPVSPKSEDGRDAAGDHLGSRHHRGEAGVPTDQAFVAVHGRRP